MKQQKGFFVLEVLLASALFVIFSAAAVGLVLQGFDANRTGNEETIANQYAAEGIEAVRSIRKQTFYNMVANTVATGASRSASNVWAFNGLNNTFGKYTRVITVADAQRDGSGNIVASGGTVDPNTKKVTSTVSWNVSPTRNNSVVLTAYLTNWIFGDWANQTIESSVDLPGKGDGLKIVVQGNYAYVIRSSGTPSFVIIDISNLTSPVIVGSLALTGPLNSISVSGNYAYVTSSGNTIELQIINVSTPSAPVLTSVYNLPGNQNAYGVFAQNNVAYVVRASGPQNEFVAIDVSVPATPTLLGSLDLTATGYSITASGNYAYVTTSDNTREFMVISISNPALPSIVGSYNIAGSNNFLAIAVYGTKAVIGSDKGDLVVLDITTPTAPTQLGLFASGGVINDISLGMYGNFAYLAKSKATGSTLSFQVVDMYNPAAMFSVGSVDLGTNSYGIVYSMSRDRVFLVGDALTQEVMILKPQ